MSASTDTHLSTARLLRAGGAAVLAAVVANIIVRFILGALLPLAPDFQPFGLGSIITFTVAFTLIGVGVLALVNRWSAHPLKTYNMIGVTALFVSILPNLAGAANPSAMPMGGNGTNYLILIIFHIVAAASFLGVLNLVVRRA